MILALIIFGITYLLIMLEKIPRHLVALIGALAVVITGLLTMENAMKFVSWETIGLLLGMFILIRILEDANFFDFLAVKTMEKVNFDLKKIFFVFPLLTGFLAAFMDSITVLLFFTILTINVCKMFNIDPIGLIIAEVCTANTGGSATLVGDPPNVIIGNLLGYGFNDFVRNTGPIAVIATIAITVFCFLFSLKSIRKADKLTEQEKKDLLRNNTITDQGLVKVGLIGFASAILLLILHTELNRLLGIHIGAAAATLLPALICLVLLGATKAEHVIKNIDGETLLFFIGLFVVVGGLEQTGVLKLLSNYIVNLSGGNGILLAILFIWISGLASSLVDNVPMALTMAYILLDMVTANPALAPLKANLAWSLAMGLDIGGNCTPIGASANVMAYSIMQKNKVNVSWGRWIKEATPATIIALLIVTMGIYLKIKLGI
jgi:Na+/H+ antiporter NhaD/arsenite permease-like protein